MTLAAANAQEGPTLQKIKNAGAITIGYRDAATPFSYVAADQRPAGFSLDLCGLVADRVKETLSLAELKIDYKLVAAQDEAALLKDGAIDIECGAASKTKGVTRDAAVSIPIYLSELRWLVPKQLRIETEGSRRRRHEVRTPASIDDLKGKAVALTEGSAATPIVLRLSIERYLGLSIVTAKNPAEAFRLVETGKASAYIDDDALLLGLKAGARNPDAFAFLDGALPSATYALLVAKDDQPFKALVDGVLADAMKSGEYEKLYVKWFESPIPPRGVNLAYPMPARLKEFIKDPAANSN